MARRLISHGTLGAAQWTSIRWSLTLADFQQVRGHSENLFVCRLDFHR